MAIFQFEVSNGGAGYTSPDLFQLSGLPSSSSPRRWRNRAFIWPELCCCFRWVDVCIILFSSFFLPPLPFELPCTYPRGESCMELPFMMHLGEKGFYPFLCLCHLLVRDRVEKGRSWFSLSSSLCIFLLPLIHHFWATPVTNPAWGWVASFLFCGKLCPILVLWWIVLKRVVLGFPDEPAPSHFMSSFSNGESYLLLPPFAVSNGNIFRVWAQKSHSCFVLTSSV